MHKSNVARPALPHASPRPDPKANAALAELRNRARGALASTAPLEETPVAVADGRFHLLHHLKVILGKGVGSAGRYKVLGGWLPLTTFACFGGNIPLDQYVGGIPFGDPSLLGEPPPNPPFSTGLINRPTSILGQLTWPHHPGQAPMRHFIYRGHDTSHPSHQRESPFCLNLPPKPTQTRGMGWI